MKAIEQHFHVVLFIMLYKVILIFKSVDETLMCDHSNERYWAVLSRGTSYLLLTAQERSKYWAMIHINISFSIFCKMIFLDPRQCFISIINLACIQSCVVYRCCWFFRIAHPSQCSRTYGTFTKNSCSFRVFPHTVNCPLNTDMKTCLAALPSYHFRRPCWLNWADQH